MHLERVVLGRDLDLEVVGQHGHLEHDVVAHARHLGEEVEGEDAGDGAEAGGGGAAVFWFCVSILGSFAIFFFLSLWFSLRVNQLFPRVAEERSQERSRDVCRVGDGRGERTIWRRGRG